MHNLRSFALLSGLAVLGLASVAFAQGSITGKVDATPPKYLGESVVYLKSVPGTFPAKTHTMDQKNMTFIPHVMAITQGDTVKFVNDDKVAHNVFSPDIEPYNLGTFAGGQSRDHTFTKPGAYSQLCSIHPEMLAYIYVSQNPYSAVVDKSGSYTIKDVPPGTYQVAIWNSHLKAADQSVTVAAGKPAEANFSLKR